ncbi:YgdI/YgdR family lipoprotein [Erwinia mallotivora]|uniref:YgdI/YgdR family lipoprotein n=1 Tax=Erwinia mallotivora TaxID=69222 RepID=UPI0035EAABCA
MKHKLIILLVAASGALLAGCSDNHMMHMKDGSSVVVQGKPHKDKATGMVLYTDENGKQQAVSQGDIKEMTDLEN